MAVKAKKRSISPGGQPASRGKEGCPADQTQCILGCTQRLAPRWTSRSRLDLSAAYATLPWHHSCSRKQKGHSAAAWDTDVIQIKLNWSEKNASNHNRRHICVCNLKMLQCHELHPLLLLLPVTLILVVCTVNIAGVLVDQFLEL